MAAGELNLNERSVAVADAMVARRRELGVSMLFVGGVRVIDAGVESVGSLGAGLMTARVCMADLAEVTVVPGRVGKTPLPAISVAVNQPLAACMASQYAGWQIKAGDYFAMGSGPMRAAAAGVALEAANGDGGEVGGEKIFNDIGFRQRPVVAAGVLESAQIPTPDAVALIARKCGVMSSNVTLVVARTASLAGGVQVVARSVETAMHKLHELGFDLHRVVAGYGVAPLPPVAKDDMKAIGRTNDAVLYGGEVTLMVRGDDDSLAQAGAKLPSSVSRDYGEPFAKVFKRYNHDFYKIDPMLFSPASVTLQNIDTGRTFQFGVVNEEVLAASFFS